jgi:hypothetical protein
MDKHSNEPRWFHVWRNGPVVQDDPADLGTAFGLDMSLMDSALDSALPEGATPAPEHRDSGH